MKTLGELKKDTLFLTRTVEGQYKPEELVRNLNNGYDELVVQIWKADSTWRFDEGTGVLPIVSTDLKKGQRDYQIPTEARTIEGAEVEIDNDIKKLTPISEEDVGKHTDNEGIPTFYYLKGRSLYLFPRAEKDVEEGLILYLSKSITQLEEDEDVLRVDREFGRYPVYCATRDWYFSTKQTREYRKAINEIDKMKKDIKFFYSRRNSNNKRGFSVKRENYS